MRFAAVVHAVCYLLLVCPCGEAMLTLPTTRRVHLVAHNVLIALASSAQQLLSAFCALSAPLSMPPCCDTCNRVRNAQRKLVLIIDIKYQYYNIKYQYYNIKWSCTPMQAYSWPWQLARRVRQAAKLLYSRSD